MGRMKDLLITIYGGGDEAVEAAKQIAGLSEIVPHDDEPRWIPVEERLPDRYIRVLAFVKCEPHEHPHAIGFVGCLGLWSLDELHEPSAVVTHWVPLPEPPQGIV